MGHICPIGFQRISYDLKPPKGSNYNDIKKSILSEMNRDLSLSICEGYGCPGSNIRKVYVIINNKKYWWIPYFKSVDIRLSKRTVKKKQVRLNRNKRRSRKVRTKIVRNRYVRKRTHRLAGGRPLLPTSFRKKENHLLHLKQNYEPFLINYRNQQN